MKYIIEHWDYVLYALVVIINILNAATAHFSTVAGLKKWVLFATEMLSILRSSGVAGVAKLPLVSIPPTKSQGGVGVIILALLGIASGSGCATVSQGINRTHEATKSLSMVIEPIMHERCTVEAEACKKALDTVCQPWLRCAQVRNTINKSIQAVHISLAAAATLDAVEKSKAGAQERLNAAIRMLSESYSLAQRAGLMEVNK